MIVVCLCSNRSHDQRELPNIPHPTAGIGAASAAPATVATVTPSQSASAAFDEEDDGGGGHYDVITRRADVLRRDDTVWNPTFVPVGSETYAGAPDPPPDALLLKNDKLDPNYAGIVIIIIIMNVIYTRSKQNAIELIGASRGGIHV